MKQKIFGSLCFGLFVLLIAGCTDVPLSFSTKVTDDRIIGYWQSSDSSVFQITKNRDGSATLIQYEQDKATKEYKQGDDPAVLYFTTIVDNAENHEFISVESKDDNGKFYTSLKFSFSTKGELLTQDINQDFLEENNEQNDDGLVTFGSPENYRLFVKSNLKNPDLFEAVTIAQRLDGLPKK